MANEEALTIDGLAVNDGISFGMLSFDAPVPRQRQEWIGAADSEAQLLTRNPLHENRKLTARITVVPQSTMDAAHDKLLLILDKLQKASKYPDGIAVTWTPATGTRTATFDVLAGEITDLPIDWENGYLAKSPTLTVEMTAKPYWRGTETLTSTASSSTPFVTLEVASVTGDVPALGRLIVTDTASQSRRHVEWGLEGPLTYSSSTSLLIDSDSMVTSGFAGALSTVAGAYDPNATGNNAITATIAVGQTVAVAGTGNLSHVGAFRVKARMAVTPGTLVRLSWRSGDGPLRSNPWASGAGDVWVEFDLGTITIPAATVGTQRWTGQVDVYNPAANANAHVDYLTLVPVSDGYGKARASYSYSPGLISGYDQFTSTTAGGALNTRSAPAGGTWATSGDTGDFLFSDDLNGEVLIRSTTSDTNGRFAILGSTNFTDVEVFANLGFAGTGNTTNPHRGGVIARWVDSSNYLRAYINITGTGYFFLEEVVGGVATNLGPLSGTMGYNPTNGVTNIFSIRLVVFSSGRVNAIASNLTYGVTQTIDATSTTLATGGTLATGKPGLFDRNPSATVRNRYYDNMTVATPAAEPIALYSGRNMQIRHDDTLRQDSTGTYTGRPASYRGSRFLVPVGTSRVLVKARRADIETSADANVTDATQIQVGWTPRGLAVPR